MVSLASGKPRDLLKIKVCKTASVISFRQSSLFDSRYCSLCVRAEDIKELIKY